MRKFIIAIAALLFSFAITEGASAARKSRAKDNGYTLSQDARSLIDKNCNKIMRRAGEREGGNLTPLCPVARVNTNVELGPWTSLIGSLKMAFDQAKKLIYVAAVFMLLWILIEGAYRGEAQWMKLWWLVLGIIGLAASNVFISIATGEIKLEDIKAGNLYVDCRRPDEALYPCQANTQTSRDIDSRYLFQYNKKGGEEGTAYKGLW